MLVSKLRSTICVEPLLREGLNKNVTAFCDSIPTPSHFLAVTYIHATSTFNHYYPAFQQKLSEHREPYPPEYVSPHKFNSSVRTLMIRVNTLAPISTVHLDRELDCSVSQTASQLFLYTQKLMPPMRARSHRAVFRRHSR